MIFTDDIIEKALRSYHSDAGGKPPRKGGREWLRQAVAVVGMLRAIEGDLRVAFLSEAVEKARPKRMDINGSGI